MTEPESVEISAPSTVDGRDPVQESELTPYQAWLAERRTMITGTDAAQILAMDSDPVSAEELARFGGPMGVYLAKIGQPLPFTETDAIVAGRKFERPILEWYAERERAVVDFPRPWTIFHSTAFPVLGASLDGVRIEDLDAGRVPVDAKNLRFYDPTVWGGEGTDEIPVYYAVQLVMQLHVTRAKFADLAVVFSGQDLRIFRLWRDEQLETDVIERCLAFKQNHIDPRIPPPVDGSPAWTDHLKRAFGRISDVVLDADREASDVAMQLLDAKGAAEAAKANVHLFENKLKALIGEARGIRGPGWRASWTPVGASFAPDWEAIARQLAKEYAGGLSELSGEDVPAEFLLERMLKDRQIQTRPSYRRFTISRTRSHR